MAEFDREKNEKLRDQLEDKMSDAENNVWFAICNDESFDKLPNNFFEKSVDELNKHFGGHDDMVITEDVRKYCALMKEYDAWCNDLIEQFGEMSEENKDSDDDEEPKATETFDI